MLRERAERSRPPVAPPGGEVLVPPRPQAPSQDRQVCVRLGADQCGELAAAADDYGISPTAMARTLARRGLGALREERRRGARAGDGAGEAAGR